MVARKHSRREMLKMLGISPIVGTLPVSPLRMQSNSKEQPQLCLVSRHVQWTMPKSQFISLLRRDVKFYNALLTETKLGAI